MSKNILKILLVFSAILLVACGGKTISTEDKVQKLRYGIATEITQINPLLNEEGHSEIDSLLFRGLMQPTETNEVKGDLAIDWKISKDLLEYQFTLREDAFWQDGQRLTAHDVKFTLDKIRDPSINSPSQSEFRQIKEVTVVSDYVLQIELTEPFPALLNKLKIGIVPKHLLEHENMNKTTFSRNPVGNGPYQLKEWGIDNTITLTRNEKYYGPSPQIDEVLFIPVPDENTRLLQLKTGELHLAQLTPSQLNAVNESDSFSVHEIPTADYRAVLYNMKLPIFQDARVRQALNLAIDREGMVEGVLFGKGEIAHGPLQMSWANTPQQEAYSFNSEKAHDLLVEAGFVKKDGIYTKEGKTLKFKLVAPSSDALRVTLASVVVEQWKDFGVDVELSALDWSEIQIDEADTFMIGWGSEFDPDDHTYRIFHSSEIGQYNYGSYENKLVDESLGMARTTSETDERFKYYEQFQQHLAVDPAFNFLVYLHALYGVSKQLEGVSNRTLGHMGFGVFWNIEEWTLE